MIRDVRRCSRPTQETAIFEVHSVAHTECSLVPLPGAGATGAIISRVKLIDIVPVDDRIVKKCSTQQNFIFALTLLHSWYILLLRAS